MGEGWADKFNIEINISILKHKKNISGVFVQYDKKKHLGTVELPFKAIHCVF